MNLSKIKTVGFIENFDPKKGYPEFAYKAPQVAPVMTIKTKGVVEEKELPTWKKNQIKKLKRAKRGWKNGLDDGYKPSLLTSNKLN